MTIATATREPLTEERIASEQARVRHNLATFVNQLTNDGATIAQFLHDTVQGEYPDAKHHHRQQAARDLAVMSGKLPQDTPGSAARVVRVSEDDSKPRPKKPKLTMKEIINWDIGRLIRQQTNDCRDLAAALNEFLHPPYVFESANKAERRYQKATRVRPHHQISAAQEMLKRGAGSRHPDCGLKTSYLEEKMLQSAYPKRSGDITRRLPRHSAIPARSHSQPQARPLEQHHRRPLHPDPPHLVNQAPDLARRRHPWEHITPDDIAEYYRELDEKQRQEAERRRAERQAAAQLTPEQEAEILALFEQINRENEQRQAKTPPKPPSAPKKTPKKTP